MLSSSWIRPSKFSENNVHSGGLPKFQWLTEETTSSQVRPELLQKKHLEPVSLCKFRVFFGPVSVDRLTLCHSLWIQLCLLRKRQLGWTLPNLRAVFLCEAVLANQRSQRKVSIRSLLFVPWKNPQQDPPFGSCESLCNLADLDDL